MPIVWTVSEGEGVRIDGTDIWMVDRILDGGASAEVIAPDGRRVTLQEEVVFRVGPGFNMWLTSGAPEGAIRLVMESYTPLMHRHPPRNHKPGAAEVKPA